MVQKTITGFLSPPAGQSNQQSVTTPPPGQRCNASQSPDLPRRQGNKKSKKALRCEKKRQRKRAKLHRSCKGDTLHNTSVTPEGTVATPMPSPASHSFSDTLPGDHATQTDTIRSDNSILITDRSLTDMLASNTVQSDSQLPDNMNESQDEIIRLESKLLASEIELQYEKNERLSLQCQVELLMKEIDDFKKTDKHQKFQIKKLVNENDKLKKEYSRVSGMRRFTDNDKPVRNNVATQMGDIDDLAHKYDRLKSRLVGITDSLLTALDDDNDFTIVSKGKHNEFTPTPRPSTSSQAPQMPSDSVAPRQRCPSVQLSNVAAPIPLPTQVPPRRRSAPPSQGQSFAQALQSDPSTPAVISRPQQPQRIPVVEIGAAARFANGEREHCRQAPVTRPKTKTVNDIIVIGSSLVDGLGSKLHGCGINATCYMYRGADIPTIRARIPHILTPNVQPEVIVLQIAGNDATKQPSRSIVARYESLIQDIRYRCPRATIVLSKIPPRRGTRATTTTINEVNVQLDAFASHMNNVTSIDVCPKSVDYFKRDLTHFNKYGITYFANELAKFLRNFSTSLNHIPM